MLEPRFRSTFVGRAESLAEIERLLQTGARLITITGTAGMGKTRLAMEIAARQRISVRICRLAQAKTSTELLASVASAFGEPILPEVDLSRFDGGLVVLDNFEGLIALGDLVARWLAVAPEVRLLITSRRKLGVAGEAVVPLAPLDLEQGLALFLERARVLRPDFEPSEVMRELVSHLDGVPLAIELAAGRSSIATPRELLDRLADRFRLMPSLEAAIELSWNLLDDIEKRVLTQCAIFSDGFSVEAAGAIISLPPGAELFDLLHRLIECSLLFPGSSLCPDKTRFSAYESVRDFALARLSDRGEVAARHARYFAIESARLFREVDGPRAKRARAELLEERANLLAANQSDHAAPEDVARTALALDALLSSLGPLALRMEVLERAAVLELEPALAAEILSARGWAAAHGGRASEGLSDLEAALAHAAASAPQEADILARIGHLHLRLGDTASARPYIERAVARSEGGEVEGRVLARLGLLHLFEGDPERAEEVLTRALAADTRHQNLLWLGYSHSNRGAARQELGLLERAQDDFERALALQEEIGDQRLLGVTRVNLGAIEQERGRSDRAEAQIREGLVALRRTVHRRAEAEALEVLGYVLISREKLGEARRALSEAEELYASFGCRSGSAGAKAALAALTALAGRTEEAMHELRRARAELESLSATEDEQRIVDVLELLIDPARDRAMIEEREVAPRHGRPARTLLRLATQLVESRAKRRPRISIDEQYRWFRIDGGSEISLKRRGAMRSILKALVQQQRQEPEHPLDVYQLFDAGWPGDNVRPDIGAARVYESIRVLRRLGLEGLLIHQDGGYLFAREVEIYSNSIS